MQLAPSLYRLGSSSLVNSYLIEDAGAITVIDAGLRGHLERKLDKRAASEARKKWKALGQEARANMRLKGNR